MGSYTQTADQDSREDLSDDDMPFQKKSSKIRIVNHAQLPVQEPVLQIEAKKEDKEKDWLLDPINLYMRGMAQRRE